MVMASKIHTNEQFLTEMTNEQLELFLFEIKLFDNFQKYLEAFNDQLNRLNIKR